MTVIKEVEIRPMWSIVSDIRKSLKEKMMDSEYEDMSDKVSMTVSELLENAIKYGKPTISLRVSLNKDHIEVMVSNSIVEQTDLDRLIERINKIREAEDPITLYYERLEDLLNSDKIESTALGLFRIASEGEFNLECIQNDDGRITVRATSQRVDD